MIIQTVSFSSFRDAFRAHDRLENFSYDGSKVLFDWLEELSDDTSTPYELDVIALCCEYYENDTAVIAKDYSLDTEGLDELETLELVRDYLETNTCIVGETSTGFVYAAF